MLESQGTGLRPLGTAGILDAAVEHVRSAAATFYLITLPLSTATLVVVLLLLELATDYRGPAAAYETRLLALAGALAVLFHLRAVAHGAVTLALARQLEGEEPEAWPAWRGALGLAVPLAFAGAATWWLNALAVVMAGLPVLVSVPLVLLQVPVQVFERRPALSALRRSGALGRLEVSRAWAITVLLAVAFLFAMVGVAASARTAVVLFRLVTVADTAWLERLLDPRHPPFLLAAALVADALLLPVRAAAHALLYVDRRVRTEGFDLRAKIALVAEKVAAPAEAVS